MKPGSLEYSRVHCYLRYHFKKPKVCENCKKTSKNPLEWACVTGIYNKDIKNYRALCRSCHRCFDGGGDFNFCKRGHRRTKANTYIRKDDGLRECLKCKRLAVVEWRKKKRLMLIDKPLSRGKEVR